MWIPFGLIGLMPISLLVFANPNQGILVKQSDIFDTTLQKVNARQSRITKCFKEFLFYLVWNILQDVPNNIGEGAGISNVKTFTSDSALRTHFNSTELLQEVNTSSHKVYHECVKYYCCK